MRRMIYCLVFICTLFWGDQVLAQRAGFCWVNRAGESNDDSGNGIALLGSDQIIVTGSVDGKLCIDDLLDNGELLWDEFYGGPAGSAEGNDVATSDSRIFVVGSFQNTVEFGSIPLLSDSGSDDIIILRLDNLGNVIWAKRAGGSGEDKAKGISVGNFGSDVFVTGWFSGQATFGPGENSEVTLPSAGERDAFVAKYDGSNGDLIWVKSGGGAQNERAQDVTNDDLGNCFIIGELGEAGGTFGAGENNETTLTNMGKKDVFIAKYGESGSLEWIRHVGSSGDDRGNGIALFIDEDDPDRGKTQLYVTGGFEGTGTFDSQTVNSVGGKDNFLARYDDDGNLIWIKTSGGPGRDESRGLFVTRRRNPLGPQGVTINVIGDFEESITFAQKAQNEITLKSRGGRDISFAKYQDGGRLLWAKSAGSVENDFGKDVVIAPFAYQESNFDENQLLHTFITGSFSSSGKFGGLQRDSNGGLDAFVARVENLGFPRNLELKQVFDDKQGLSSFVKLSWDQPINASAPFFGVLGTSLNKSSDEDCVFPDGSKGTSFSMNLIFDDLTGDLSDSSTVNVYSKPSPFGAEAQLNSGSLTVTEVQGGELPRFEIFFTVCIKFGDADQVILTIAINDDAGNLSPFTNFSFAFPKPGNQQINILNHKNNEILAIDENFPGTCGGSANLLSYNIYRKNNKTNVTQLIANVPVERRTYVDQHTEAGTDYTYRVTAVYANSESEHVGDTQTSGSPSPNKLFELITEDEAVLDGGNTVSNSWGDYDNDGFLDLFVTNSAGINNSLYHNNSDGTFSKMNNTQVGQIVNDAGNSYGSSWGDYNNDGTLDLFVANSFFGIGQQNFLYKNVGGNFTKITSGNVVTDNHDSNSGTWADYDNDGFLDLFVANGSGLEQNNVLYRNDGPPNYTFTSVTSGDIVTDGGRSISGSWADYDGDADLDLFVANIGQNFLYKNNGDGTFNRISEAAFIETDSRSMGGSWGDMDNDGDLDLFVPNDKGTNFLFKNVLVEQGAPTFEQIATGEIAGDDAFSFGSSWGDYDNDGDVDLFVTNIDNNYLYENVDGLGSLSKVSNGNNIVNNVGNSNGCAWADYNKDGFLDVFVTNSFTEDDKNYLYLNNKSRGTNSNNWINLFLKGTVSNTSAIGAKIKLKASINGTSLWQTREISGLTGGGWGGQNSLNAGFGLGDATTIDSIRIEWPSGNIDEMDNVAVNQFLEIEEVDVTPAVNELLQGLPTAYNLSQNYPNPFNPTTIIQYALPEAQYVSLKIYNASGRLVQTVVNQNKKAGNYQVELNLQHFANGVFFYHLQAGGFSQTRKMILLK